MGVEIGGRRRSSSDDGGEGEGEGWDRDWVRKIQLFFFFSIDLNH